MLTKLMIESFYTITNLFGSLFAAPFVLSKYHNRIVCHILHPRWRLITWHLIALVVLPIQLIELYRNIIAEALKIKQESANLTYLIFTLFCAAIATFGLFMNLNLAVKLNVCQLGVNQLFFLNQYSLRKLHLLSLNILVIVSSFC